MLRPLYLSYNTPKLRGMADPGRIGGPIIAPSTASVSLIWNLPNGRFGANQLHGQYTGSFTPTVTLANALLTALTTGALWTAFATHIATSAALTRIDIRDINTAGNAIVSSSAAGQLGTGALPALAGHTALVATLRTARAGRNARGRAYLPGFNAASMGSNGQGITALNTDVGNWIANWISVFNAQGLTLCIPQPARQAYTGETGTNHPARPVGTPSIAVTSVTLRNLIFDTQRRREGRS